MKNPRLKKKHQTPDCAATMHRTVDTPDGPQEVYINMSTGEITYGPGGACDGNALRECLSKEGLELEEEGE